VSPPQEGGATSTILQALIECHHVLMQSRDERELAEGMCRIVVEIAGYPMAWVGYAEPDAARTVVPLAQVGVDRASLTKLDITYEDGPRGRSAAGTAIRTGKVQVVQDLGIPAYEPWREVVTARGWRSAAAVPLMADGRPFGVLATCASAADAFTSEALTLLSALAIDLAFGITSRRIHEDRLRVALASLDVSVFTQDLELRYTWIYRPQLGYRSHAIVGHTDQELLPAAAARDATVIKRRALEQGKPSRGEVHVELPDGRACDYELIAEPLREPDGQVRGILGASLDVSERKRAETRLRQAEKLEAVGRLAGGVAHDFNNVLAVVLANAELLRAELPVESGARELVDEMHTAAQRAADLTARLLAFSRPGPGGQQTVDLHAIVREVTTLMSRTVDRRIELDVRLGASQPRVRGDSTSVQSAILNLAVNARDAMPSGGRITFSTADREIDGAGAQSWPDPIEPGRYVEVSVQDTGEGIPEENRALLFEPFFTTKAPDKGTGLGLPAVRACARSSGGSVNFESAVGRGTTFRLIFPCALPTAPETPLERSPVAGAGRVLVVDDDDMVRDGAGRTSSAISAAPRHRSR
jgi:PAS domain S-box-containing protein